VGLEVQHVDGAVLGVDRRAGDFALEPVAAINRSPTKKAARAVFDMRVRSQSQRRPLPGMRRGDWRKLEGRRSAVAADCHAGH
jgi:hypothetical protein